MKTFKRMLASSALVCGLAVAGSANATLINWYLDSDGAGGNAPVLVADYLDLTGTAFVKNSFTSFGPPPTFTFNEVGSFLVLTADGSTVLSPFLTASFVATGSGAGNLLSFNYYPNSLTVKSGANTVGVFDLLTGGSNLTSGTVLPVGAVGLVFQANTINPGYLFDSSMTDISTLLSGGAITMGFVTTNVITVSGTVSTGLVDAYNAAFDPDLVGVQTHDGLNLLKLSNNGQFRIAVPEPGTLLLLGVALAGLGFGGSRRKQVAA